MRVRLDEVVDKIAGDEDRLTTKLEYYIGGEHIDSESILINQRGLLKSDKGRTLGYQFHYPFQKGDTLFMTKNPYLKKCGMVDFDGICSVATFVLRTKNNNTLLEKYLPIVTQTDDFWDYMESHKSGSVNYFITWKTLGSYEFDLPSIEEQKKLSETLWQIMATIDSYKKLLAKIDELVKAKFVEIFGDFYKNDKNWPIKNFEEFAKIDANMTKDYEKYADFPHIGIDSIEKETGKLVGYRTVKQDNVISPKYIFTNKHIIYSKIRPNLNKVALPDFEGLCSADAYPILPNYNVCNRLFLAITMRSSFFLDYILKFSNRSNMPKVNREQISGFKMPLPPLELQNQYEIFVQKSEETKSAIQASLDSLKQVYKKIITENLGGK